MPRTTTLCIVALLLVAGTASASATWDSATWDSATWDSATWDGSPTASADPWALEAIHAPDAWSLGVPARTKLVCLLDSGADVAHPDLAGSVGPTRDFLRGGSDVTDLAGHGTAMAGLVASVGAPLLAIGKVLDASGQGPTSALAEGIAWCADLHADVILLALSEDAPTKALQASLERAIRGGALVVAAAGNDGSRALTFPASDPRTLSVGAVGPDMTVAPFSDNGPRLDLLAPGVGVMSAWPGGLARAGSGTSQAAALTAGAAALVRAQHPEANAHQVAQALKQAARPAASPTHAAGVLDVAAASRALTSR